MLKRIFLALFVSTMLPAFLCAGVAVDPGDYTGYRRDSEGGITSNGYWAEQNFTIMWDITYDGASNKFHYIYTVGDTDPYNSDIDSIHDFDPICGQISHLILQVSDTFTLSDIEGVTGVEIDELRNFEGGSEPGSPGLPADIYGIKFETYDDDEGVIVIDFFSPRVPEWGDFYAKDGRAGGSGVNYAYNTGFDSFPTEPFGYWIPRPDTVVIPEPSTMVILGTSLGAMALKRRRKKKEVESVKNR